MQIIALILIVQVIGCISTLDEQQVIAAIKQICLNGGYLCLKPEYGTRALFRWQLNEAAVTSSKAMKVFRELPLNRNTIEQFKSSFCCTEGDCLQTCNGDLMIPREIDLIDQFPHNGRALMSLNFKPLEPSRQSVEEYLGEWEKGREKEKQYNAEVEDFLDKLHEHQDTVRKLLKERGYKVKVKHQ